VGWTLGSWTKAAYPPSRQPIGYMMISPEYMVTSVSSSISCVAATRWAAIAIRSASEA
jgi:hypothetical protein